MSERLYPELKGTDRVWVECGKCGGTGIFDYGRVVYESNGAIDRWCFDCHGKKGRHVLVSSLRASARRRERKAEAEQKAFEAKESARFAWEGQHGALLRKMKQYEKNSEVLSDWVNTVRIPSEKALELIEKVVAEQEAKAAELAAAAPVPTGRIEIVGQIVGMKEVVDSYSYTERHILKMVVQAEQGFKVYGTMPDTLARVIYDRWMSRIEAETGEDFDPYAYGSQVWWSEARGSTVRFTATVEPSRDDEKFGFFKRPTKAELI